MTRTARIAESAELAATETLALAAELATYARAAHDAVTMLEAARMLRALPPQAFAPGSATAVTLFAEARLIASGDRAMLAEINAVQYGYTRPIAGGYAAESWIVRYQGTGSGLAPNPASTVHLRIADPVWTGPVAARVA